MRSKPGLVRPVWFNMGNSLSTDLDSPSSVPYFLWDEPMKIAELRDRLANGSAPERARLLGKILREARDTDVWKFTTPREVWRNWNRLSRHLGRRREFWTFMFEFWEKEGLLDEKPDTGQNRER
jgi:hypothetical protein